MEFGKETGVVLLFNAQVGFLAAAPMPTPESKSTVTVADHTHVELNGLKTRKMANSSSKLRSFSLLPPSQKACSPCFCTPP